MAGFRPLSTQRGHLPLSILHALRNSNIRQLSIDVTMLNEGFNLQFRIGCLYHPFTNLQWLCNPNWFLSIQFTKMTRCIASPLLEGLEKRADIVETNQKTDFAQCHRRVAEIFHG